MYLIKLCIHSYLRLPDYGDSSLKHKEGLCRWIACTVHCVQMLVYIKDSKYGARNK